MPGEKLTKTVCFGEFQLDLESGELYRLGRRTPLHDQPFRLLKLFLKNPGELVSRDEIRMFLWPNGTIVEFVNSLNAAVKKLRSALGDSADQPRYIETVKGHGYRLIMPVESSSNNISRQSGAQMRADEHSGQRSAERREHLPGQHISHYQILDKIGAGGMGVVYRAEDAALGRHVALKFLSDELSGHPAALERLRLEARAASALNHPNICTIYEIGEEAGQTFIAMELLEGSTLRDRISAAPLTLDEVRDYGLQIAEGLDAAHSKGIVHRDIKPANIFITDQGRAKIIDFGLCQLGALGAVAKERITRPGAAPGTAAYMSPEQARGEPLDARTDLFSFGLVLFEMATGTRPVAGVKLSDELSRELEHIISKCLQADRERRYRRASEIGSDLQRPKLDAGSTTKIARHWKPIASLTTIVLVVSVAALVYFHRSPKLTDKDTIVLADFVNRTGDPVFDGTLRQGLAVQLEQSPFLSLISERRIQQTLRLMAQPDARLTPELGREVCERIGSAAMLEGSIASLGSKYVLALRATNCRNGNVVDEEQVQAAKKEDVLNALTQIAGKFRSRVGESLATVQEHDTPLAEATTPSLEALKAYSAAQKVALSVSSVAAAPLYRRAIEIDPQFAMAHAALGLAYASAGESDLAMESTGKAYRCRDRASERERFFITVNYDREVTRNLPRAQQTCELWAQTYPRDANAHVLSSGFISQGAGNYEKSIEEARKAIELDPDHTYGYVNLAASYFYLNRLGEAEHTIRRASERKLQVPEFLLFRYYIAFLKGDKTGMDREAAQAAGKSGAEDWMLHSEALVLAHSGRLELARRMSLRAVDVARQAGQRERAATYEAGAALREALFGNAAAAKRDATEALELSNGRDVEYGVALALALAGDSARPAALANDLERRFPEDTSVRFTYLPTLRARLALNDRVPARAIELLEVASRYELAVPGITFFGFFGGLYPAYMRGEAYLAAHRGADAAAEFQKVLDHRGIVMADPIGVLSYLQLGRAFASAGDKTKAKAAYQDFLGLWKDADQTIPILKQAKAEYGKLP